MMLLDSNTKSLSQNPLIYSSLAFCLLPLAYPDRQSLEIGFGIISLSMQPNQNILYFENSLPNNLLLYQHFPI
jgi:hypothetical protein